MGALYKWTYREFDVLSKIVELGTKDEPVRLITAGGDCDEREVGSDTTTGTPGFTSSEPSPTTSSATPFFLLAKARTKLKVQQFIFNVNFCT